MIEILAFYHFSPLDRAARARLKASIESLGARRGLKGLILIGPEGINLTASGSAGAVDELKRVLATELPLRTLNFKFFRAPRDPFRVLRVKLRREIVTLGRPDLVPPAPTAATHLSPAEWHDALRDPEAVVLDTRNDYEVALGKFKGAVDFGTREFRDFPARLRAAAIPKDKPILIYCTGGIRCEKAALALNEEGYADVRQLGGGILNYLEEFPDGRFEGECFVFDYRVAVDRRLAPTARYVLCPHCGQPANQTLACAQCDSAATLCARCAPSEPTCSKTCAHHRAIGSKSRRPHAPEGAKRRRVGSSPQSVSSSAPAGD